MFELTKKTDYGVELMIELARRYQAGLAERGLAPPGPVPLREIAKDKRLSFKFLEQVAIPLKEADLIGAKEGKSGGYFLNKDPLKISVIEIVEALEGKVAIKNCQKCLREEVCAPKNIWRDLEMILQKELEKKSLKDLVLKLC